MLFYTLDADHKPIPTNNATEWTDYRKFHKRIGLTQLSDCWVSTTFLGIDHGFSGDPPILFETMVFDGQYADCKWGGIYCKRYATWGEAVAGHARIVEKLKTGWRPEE